MATSIGRIYLVRYYEASEEERATLVPRLQQCLDRKYITQAEYDRALTGEPPEGYVAPTPSFSATTAEA